MFNENGFKTFAAGEAIPYGRRVKLHTDGTVVFADADHSGDGVSVTEAKAAGDDVTVKLWGAPGTFEIEAAGAVATPGLLLYAAADGKVQTEPAGAGTYYRTGTSGAAASGAGSIIEVLGGDHVSTHTNS